MAAPGAEHRWMAWVGRRTAKGRAARAGARRGQPATGWVTVG